jgi:diguanylate cyclase (GGDEF)-like protein
VAGIAGLIILRDAQHRFLVLLLLEVVFLLTIRLSRRGMAVAAFFLVLLAGLFTGFGREYELQKWLNLAVFAFTGYLIYYFFKSIRDELTGNTTFIQEEQKNIEFQKVRFAEAEHQVQSLKEQHRIWQQLSGLLNKSSGLNKFDEICSFFPEQVARQFPGSICVFCLRDTDSSKLGYRIKAVSEHRTGAEIDGPSPDNLDELAETNRIPLLIEDASHEFNIKLERRTALPFASMMAAPVPINERFFGMLKCYHEQPGRFHTPDLRVLQYLAETQGVQLLNSLLYQETERLARTDGITGLYVQYFLMEKIREEIARARNNSSSFSLVIIDIDHFKLFNDTYGHLAGDFVLVHTADLIRSCIRSVDFPARYGGDEFFLVLPETDETGAATLAERIRLKLLESSTSLVFNGVALDRRITASFGVSAYKPEHGDIKSFVDRVDHLMYQAKQAGRNRVYTEHGPYGSSS